MRNYNTQNNLPFPRASRIFIDYPPSQVVSAAYTEVMAMVDAQGRVQTLDGAPEVHSVNVPRDMTQPFQLYSPVTGDAIPGATMTYQQLLLGIYSVIHAHQLWRDEAAAAAAGQAAQQPGAE